MFRRLVMAVTTIVAVAIAAVVVSDLAQAGRGGGGGGGGGGRAVHSSGGVHAGSLHSGRSSVGSLSRHSTGSRYSTGHSTLSHRAPKHGVSHTAKPSSLSHKTATNKTNKSLTHNTLGTHHKFFGRRVFVVWFGPIFWPYAFYDVFDYVFWVCDDYYYYSYGCYDYYGPFWAYGYDDLFGGIYWSHYARDYRGYGSGDHYRRRQQVARNDPRGVEPQGARTDELAQLCGGEAASLVHFPFDKIEQRVAPTDAQRASFEALKSAAAKAADKLKASCPSEPALGPLGRLDTAEQRLDAMLEAVGTVRAPLIKFYDSLDDQQKARLDAMGLSPRREAGKGGGREAQAGVVPRICGERTNAVAQLSIEEIEKNVRPTDAQRPPLADLRDASVRAADTIKAACPNQAPLTATGRIEAVEGRLGAMLDAIKMVRGPLEKFYDSLSDEQRVRFNRMGPPNRRTG